MTEPSKSPSLFVEGKNDRHVVVHLLMRHGIDYDAKPWPDHWPEVKYKEGVEGLVDSIGSDVKFRGANPLGFVLDADTSLANAWSRAKDRLCEQGIAVPEVLPQTGFMSEPESGLGRVGVWIMPDNVHDGKIEDFLGSLLDESDKLLPHAKEATAKAKQLDPRFSEPDTIKAELHTWLSWQEEPGLPYGTALRARYFDHDSPAALAFVKWFRRLYGITEPPLADAE